MRRLLRFTVSGGTAAAVQLGLFYALTAWVGLWYVASAVTAWMVSLVVSFSLQRRWTFERTDRSGAAGHFGVFLALGLANTAINAALLFALVEWAGAPYLVAQLGLAAVIAAWNFLIMRLIFRRSEVPEG